HRLLRQPVVGDDHDALLGSAEPGDRQGWDLGAAEPLGGFQAPMTGKDGAGFVDQDRVCPKLLDATHQPGDLRLGRLAEDCPGRVSDQRSLLARSCPLDHAVRLDLGYRLVSLAGLFGSVALLRHADGCRARLARYLYSASCPRLWGRGGPCAFTKLLDA